MNAAIYARRSTAQNVAEEMKSVTRQEELARAFAAKRGWTITDEDVFIDDGISGTEFERRPGLQALLAAANRRAFQSVIVSERKSLGRETDRTALLISDLRRAGVEVYRYTDGKCLTPRSHLDKLLGHVEGYGDEDHVVKTSERVHEGQEHKIEKGYWVGGRVFGYRNVDVTNGIDAHGRPLRLGVRLEVNNEEAAVVRRIFEDYASGKGLKRIAKELTNERTARPKPQDRRDGLSRVEGWSPSTVGTVLGRELYHGIHVWNRSRKRDPLDHNVNQQPRPESEWKRTPWPWCEIIDDDLWARVASRRKDTAGRTLRFDSGRLSGRPPKHATKNLLAGLATCGVCGGGLVVETGGRKRGRHPEYICHRRRCNGSCSNTLRVRVSEMNEAVLSAVEEHALTPEAIEQVVRLSERHDARDQQEALAREQKDIARRLKHLVAAIEAGGEVPTLVAKIRELETRQAAIQKEKASLRPVPRLAPAVVENRLAEWRRLLRQSTTQGRAVLQRVLQGRLTFTPRADGQGYDFSAPTRFDKLFSGIVVPKPAFVQKGDVRGTEHLTPEDTFDGDYGRLLERAYRVKGLASPGGVEPPFSP